MIIFDDPYDEENTCVECGYRETPDADTWERRADGALFTAENLSNIVATNESVLYRPTPNHVKFG